MSGNLVKIMLIEVHSADELQSLIRYHSSSIVEAIDNGGIKPSQRDKLEATILRMLELARKLVECKLG